MGPSRRKKETKKTRQIYPITEMSKREEGYACVTFLISWRGALHGSVTSNAHSLPWLAYTHPLCNPLQVVASLKNEATIHRMKLKNYPNIPVRHVINILINKRCKFSLHPSFLTMQIWLSIFSQVIWILCISRIFIYEVKAPWKMLKSSCSLEKKWVKQ